MSLSVLLYLTLSLTAIYNNMVVSIQTWEDFYAYMVPSAAVVAANWASHTLETVVLTLVYVQVFRGVIRPQTFRRVHRICVGVGVLLACLLVAVHITDTVYTRALYAKGIDYLVNTGITEYIREREYVTQAYLCLDLCAIVLMTLVVVALAYMRKAVSGASSNIKSSQHNTRREIKKIDVLPVVYLLDALSMSVLWVVTQSYNGDMSKWQASYTKLTFIFASTMGCVCLCTVLYPASQGRKGRGPAKYAPAREAQRHFHHGNTINGMTEVSCV
ncbi:hypothetical protein KIPB_001160 [Kipferlia bialata]|uniref:Uncharacterized protein n=1 Tax=Kipferlia bialata TaxID=797122 RepID=A0A9K3GFC7_9EUKA|nr:hypothetical protein KIPB_001160 [Kipferlia bialata]|eukprot:g1160.t1